MLELCVIPSAKFHGQYKHKATQIFSFREHTERINEYTNGSVKWNANTVGVEEVRRLRKQRNTNSVWSTF